MSEEIYYQLPKNNPTMTTVQGIFCFDQQKWNLFGLVEPRIDSQGIEAARGNPVADSINAEMFVELREALKLPPLKFLANWKKLSGWKDELTECWPDGHNLIIEQRVRALCEVRRYDNVIEVNFRRMA